MKVFIEKTGQTVSTSSKDISGTALLKELNISPESVIIVQSNTVMLPEEKLSDKEIVRLLSVVSGG